MKKQENKKILHETNVDEGEILTPPSWKDLLPVSGLPDFSRILVFNAIGDFLIEINVSK